MAKEIVRKEPDKKYLGQPCSVTCVGTAYDHIHTWPFTIIKPEGMRYSFSPDDLQQIVRLMANATDRYIFSDTGDDALHEIVTKFPDMFVYADEDRIALRSEWQHDDKKLPMAYFDFGYSAADIKQLCAAAKKHCTTQNEQLPSCANRVE